MEMLLNAWIYPSLPSKKTVFREPLSALLRLIYRKIPESAVKSTISEKTI